MENDSIRTSGTNTLIDLWVGGKLRAVSISRAAIETYLGSSSPVGMSESVSCEFVRTHLTQIVAAVQLRLREDPGADKIAIVGAQLGSATDRRKGERRQGERRKTKLPPELLPLGERRRGERRTRERRKAAPPEA